MPTWLEVLGSIIGIVGLGASVLFWIKRSLSDEVSLNQRDAALRVESDRIAVMEAAAVKERAKRQSDFDAKAVAVRSASDAVDLLRGELSGAGDTETN